MTAPTDLLNFVARQTFSTEGNSPCVSCKRSVSLLPLRYAVIGHTDSALPPALARAEPLASLPLTAARYAVRALREGYLYVFIHRTATDWVCEGAYQTYSSGLCKAVWPATPDDLGLGGLPDFGDRVIQVSDPEDVNEARLLFTPDLLTPRLLAEIRTQPRLRNTLRKVDIRQLIQSCSHTAHIIEAQALDSSVADLLGPTSPPLMAQLDEQLFAPPAGYSALAGVAARLGATATQAQGFAVVLDDPIGITQELNAWRNQSVETLETFMRKTDGEGIDNQRKHTIAFGLENLKLTLAEQAEQRYVNHANALGVRYTDREYASSNVHMVTASMGSYRSFRNPADQQHQERHDIELARQDSWAKRYAPSVDEARLQAFMAEFDAAVTQADAIKEQRAADHLQWLNSTALLEAFAYYDAKDSGNGLEFEAQLGVAVAGMNSTALGEAQIDSWSALDGTTPNNWFWRGLAQNQTQAIEQINLLLAQRSQLPTLDGTQLQALSKSLVDIYAKAHALVGEVSLNTPPSAIRLSGAVLLTNTFGTRLLQSGAASRLDGPLNTALALVFKARLGHLGEQLHFESRTMPLSQGVKAKIGLAAHKSFGDSLAAGAAGPMLEVRLGSTLALLEVWNLKLKAEKADKGTREYIELTAAMLAVSAVGLELGAVAVGLAERSHNTAIRQAGRVMGSQLKLMAGVLAGGAAFAGMAFDIADGVKAFNQKKWSIAAVYFVRATAQLSAAFFSAAIGLAAAAPYLERLIQIHGRNRFLVFTHQKSTQLALKMAFMLRWCIRINLVIFAASVALEMLLPNELQNYLNHCTFRKDRSNGTPKSVEQELKNFHKAIEATL
ncbi:T6SS effector BTH_I2691 family protein [Pseudomonas sp. A-B-19]|uniref:T6SS effector BTH_I2691 family protein n=1 Tax=Pseudomonas sp. A-B-19 TaxID=2832405 RepID=UPI001CBE05CE|nr:T6SS effector BTH_I2691 family protein [Pseudomonas sp. A-B-19]